MRSDKGERRLTTPGTGLLDRSGGAQAVEYVIRNCPAAVTLAELSDLRIVVDSQQMETMLKCTTIRTGSKLNRQWSSKRNFDDLIARFRRDGQLDAQEVRLQKNDGEQFCAAVSARRIEIAGQDFIFLHTYDLTEQLAAKAEISRQRDVLHDAEKLSALGQLLSGISHELNNPLSVLAGQALMLKEKAADEKTAKRADIILKAADRSSRIVRSFLDLARSKAPDLIAVDLNELVAEAVEEAGKGVRELGAEIVLELPSTIPRIMADPDQIRQVFVNLIVNARHALKASEGPKRITVLTKYKPDSEQVELLFSDTGVGIPDEVSSRIFDPLFTTKDPGEGTGLGLALCRRILEAHGGTIELRSTSRRGTVFRVVFSKLSTSGAVPDPVVSRARASAGFMHVLIMDNRIEVGEALAETISSRGHGVEFVESAFVGFERLRRRRFDAIFVQAGFGELNLGAAVRAIEKAQHGAANSVVFLLSPVATEDVQTGIEELERPYLTEPYSDEAVFDTLQLLKLRRAA